jgi:uncharacterized damage-inducible protein DinB
MTTLADHARSMIASTIWADSRILTAAEGISGEQYAQLRSQLEHMLGTQRYWYANWIGGMHTDPELPTLAEARAAYAASHDAMREFGSRLTQDEWERAEQWWLQWGVDARMALGESITQVFHHGVQHRSEMAVLLSLWGHSPGDMDYLNYLSSLAGSIPTD